MEQQLGPTPPGQQPPPPQPGLPREPGIFGRAMTSGYQPSQDEAQAAFVTHVLAGSLAFISCGFLGALGAVLGLLLAKERRPFLLYHVNQAIVLQLGVLGASIVLGIVNFVLSVLSAGCLGFLLMPLSLLVWLGGSILPVVVAFAVKEGQWKPYPLVGEKVLNEWKPLVT